MIKRIAIVSSFAESCGNAYFSKILMDSIRQHGYYVKCFGLNLLLTQSTSRVVRTKANKHIKDICNKLKNFDGVNIQFEAGLFGSLPNDIFRRMKMLLNSNTNINVTLHSPRLFNVNSNSREIIKMALNLNFRKMSKLYLEKIKQNIYIRINRRLINYLKNKNINIIVHTLRAYEQINLYYNYNNISVHPLKMVSKDIIIKPILIKNIRNKYKFDDKNIIIGMFGYISEYKGYTLAIDALSCLPENYNLLFFGRQHPKTIKENECVGSYIDILQKKIKMKGLQQRIFFMGEYNTDTFISLMASVDIVWLPYIENNQDGSGIASIAFDVAKRILCSSSFVFDEMLRLIPHYKNYMRFDIGNYMELASKTYNFSPIQSIFNYQDNNAISQFTVESQAELYIKLLI